MHQNAAAASVGGQLGDRSRLSTPLAERQASRLTGRRWTARPWRAAYWLLGLVLTAGQAGLAQSTAGLVAFEAEDGEPAAPARAVQQTEHGISGVGFVDIQGGGRVEYRVNLPADGAYALWVHTRWPTDGAAELELGWRDRPDQALAAPAKREAWSWIKAAEPVPGQRGPHAMMLVVREGRCQVDQVLLTTDLSARVYRAEATQNALLDESGMPHVPWAARAAYEQAMRHKQNGQLDEYEKSLSLALFHHHDYLDALHALAWAEAKAGETAAAVTSFLRVLALQPPAARQSEAEAALTRLKDRLGPGILVFSPTYAAALALATRHGFASLGSAAAEARWQEVTGQPIASHLRSSLALGEYRIQGLSNTGDDVLVVTRPAAGDQQVAKLALPTPGVASLGVFGRLLATPQGECLAVTARELLVFRPEALHAAQRKARPAPAYHASQVCWAAGATRVIVAGQQLECYELASLERQWAVTPAGEIPSGGLGRSYAVTVSPDGRFVATAGHFGPAQIFELDSGRLLRTFAPRSEADKVYQGALGLSRDGSHLWWYRDGAGSVERLAVSSAETSLTVPVAGKIDCLAAARTAPVMCGHGPAGGDWRAPIEFLQAWDEATGQAVAFAAQ